MWQSTLFGVRCLETFTEASFSSHPLGLRVCFNFGPYVIWTGLPMEFLPNIKLLSCSLASWINGLIADIFGPLCNAQGFGLTLLTLLI